MGNIRLADVPRSVVVERTGSTPLRFSTRRDYIEYLVAQDVYGSQADILANSALVESVQQDWLHRTGQVGCRFAQFMASSPGEFGWERVVLAGESPEAWEPRELGSLIAHFIANPNSRALSLVFPEIIQESQVLQLIKLMAALPICHLQIVDQRKTARATIRVGLRVRISQDVDAFALALGPFENRLPLTRCAPLLELAFPVKQKVPPLRYGLTDDPASVHLADVPLNLTDRAWKRMIDQTRILKRQVLQGAHPGAKARVTFSFSASLWERFDN